MTRIDLSRFTSEGVRVLSGRDRGIDVRKALELSKYDDAPDAVVEIVIPPSVPFVNSSFFLGLIGESVIHLGRENFIRRYRISGTPLVIERFQQAIDRVLLNTAPLP